jgi:hypothetical protein
MSLLPAGLMLCALGAKETALLFPGLTIVVVLAMASGSLRERGLHAARVVLPQVVAIVGYLIARFSVGPVFPGRSGIPLDELGFQALITIGRVLFGIMPSAAGTQQLVPLLALVVLVLATATVLTAHRNRNSTIAWVAPAWLLGSSWLVAVSAIYAGLGVLRPWYLLIPVAALSILLGIAVDGLWTARWNSALARVTPWVGTCAMGALIVLLTLQSPLSGGRPEWETVTTLENAYLADLKQRIAEAPDGSLLKASNALLRTRTVPGASVDVAAIALAHYSLPAWAELVLPERRLRFVTTRNPVKEQTPAADEVVIVIELPKPRARELRDAAPFSLIRLRSRP